MSPSPDLILTSDRVLTPKGERPAAVLIKGEKILDIVTIEDVPADCPIENCEKDVIMPGLVDAHVHLNEPGRTDWEGFETGTKAAAAGGVTTLVDMPLNSIPVTTTADAFQAKLDSCAGKLWADCGFYGGLIPGNLDEIESLKKAGVLGLKTFLCASGINEFPEVSEADLRDALPMLSNSGLPLLVHAEIENGIESNGNPKSYRSHLESRPDVWELNAIQLLINLCAEFHTPIHIVHLSASAALDEIAEARHEDLPISVETCPHYLHFRAEQIRDGETHFKCAPPIREAANRERLWRGLESGIIHFIASDHSPCPPEMKNLTEGSYTEAWGGISSLQLTLPVIWTECRNRGYSLADLTNWLSSGPAKFIGFGNQKGEISKGFDADLVCWDPEAEFQVDTSIIHHKHKLTPYQNERLFGMVKKTYLRGKMVYNNGGFPMDPPGKPLLRNDVN